MHISSDKGVKNIRDIKSHLKCGLRDASNPSSPLRRRRRSYPLYDYIRGAIAFRISGVSRDHTYFLSSPPGRRTTTLWAAQTLLAKLYFHTYTHEQTHTHTGTHTPDSSPRETWLLWRQSNQAAVTMETEVIGPFCMCGCPLTFSISAYYKAATELCSAPVRRAGSTRSVPFKNLRKKSLRLMK